MSLLVRVLDLKSLIAISLIESHIQRAKPTRSSCLTLLAKMFGGNRLPCQIPVMPMIAAAMPKTMFVIVSETFESILNGKKAKLEHLSNGGIEFLAIPPRW